MLAPTNATTGAIDVAINPANPQIVYAAMWDHKRNNGARVYGGVGSGLFRSKDGGDTWERLQNIVDPLPAYDQTQTGLKQDASLGRIGVTIAPSDPNRVYVVSGSPYGPDKGFYFSDDGGDSFHVGGRAYQTSSGYQWWFGRLWVDPLDKNHIFNADVCAAHVDQRRPDLDGDQRAALRPARRWTGTRTSPAACTSATTAACTAPTPTASTARGSKATNQPWNQSYHLAVSQQDPQRMTTGLQDNGSRAHVDGGGAVADRPGADQLERLRRRRRPLERDRPGRPDLLLRVLPAVAAAAFVRRVPRHGDRDAEPDDLQQRLAGEPALDDRHADRRRPEQRRRDLPRRHRARALGQPRRRVHDDQPADDAHSLPGPVPADENDLGPFYANEYATISAIAPGQGRGRGAVRADALRRDRHRPRVEDDRRGRDTGRG